VLSSNDGFEDALVVCGEEIESLVGAPVLGLVLGDLGEHLGTGGRVVESGEEVEVPTISGEKELS
jgi:hypothetical protein